MKKFRYKAKSHQGETLTGFVEATDEKRAAVILQERELVVISLTLSQPNIFTQLFNKLTHRIGLSDITIFTRQLSTMITTGLTINASLNILKEQSSPAFREIIDDIIRHIEGGSSLGDALSKHPEIFNQVYVSLVDAGEEAGVLDQILGRLADNLEKQKEFQSKVKGAMIYPAVIVIGMVIVATIMMIFVIPKMMALYEGFQAKLPTATVILITISKFFTYFWWLILLIIGGLFVFWQSFSKTPFGRRKIDEITLQIPVVGNLKKQITLTETTRTLGLLAGAGISIIDALQITAKSVDNLLFEDRLNEAAKQVEKGASLATTLAAYEEFPPIIPQMVSIGEETGKIDEVLIKVSRYFEQESEQMVKGLTNIIEPLIMIVLGCGVAFLVMAIIMPIYNLTSQL